jgi:hypothetical protein
VREFLWWSAPGWDVGMGHFWGIGEMLVRCRAKGSEASWVWMSNHWGKYRYRWKVGQRARSWSVEYLVNVGVGECQEVRRWQKERDSRWPSHCQVSSKELMVLKENK